jgi:hypothetical protein
MSTTAPPRRSLRRNPRFLSWLIALVGCCLLYWLIGPARNSAFDELMSIYLAGGLTALWLLVLFCFGLCVLGRALRGRWKKRHGLPPLPPQEPFVAAVVLSCALLPLCAFALTAWISLSNRAALRDAQARAEILVQELNEYHRREGRPPADLASLPAGDELPRFAGTFAYSGGGPSTLALHEEIATLSGGTRVWTFDAESRAWTSVAHHH